MDIKQFPRAGCTPIGADYRRLVLGKEEGYADLTVRSALAHFEAKDGKVDALCKQEFFRGWRLGKSGYALDRLALIRPYLNADQLDQLGTELMDVAKRWGAVKPD